MTLAQLVLLSKEEERAHDPKKRKKKDRGSAADLMAFARMKPNG